ncbi:epimerase family protein SDR39U1-like isoform X2 [Amphibalanus amphitrite]|uniref:epimerase family protein SDR39U1-like isoform X2 n=2 Tax=Amphibalanus amphitrite TaxID=1232801 RepID=UPI001C908668|nr:epimerase family protein SDR39U1-like isoform X2 [Amphibalanus amphitrite]
MFEVTLRLDPEALFVSGTMSQSRLGTVLVGGGSGFIGTSLTAQLRKRGYDVMIVSRKPGPYRMTWSELSQSGLPKNTTAVVGLSGQNVLDPLRRWTPGFRQNVWASRVNSTRSLAEVISAAPVKPNVFVSISGVGFYEPSETAEYNEESAGGEADYMGRLCTAWEEAARGVEDAGVRSVIIRSGVVLGRHGGMIQQIFMPFYLGLGGPIGSGRQFFPWIHIDDIVSLFIFAIENPEVSGVLNGVAPQPVTNGEFSAALAGALHRPGVIPLPAAAVRLAFGETRARMMVEGQRVLPRRPLQLGFQYRYPDIESACREVARLRYTPVKPY